MNLPLSSPPPVDGIKAKLKINRPGFSHPVPPPPPPTPARRRLPLPIPRFRRLIKLGHIPFRLLHHFPAYLRYTITIFIILLATAGIVTWWQGEPITREEYLEATIITDDTRLAVDMSFHLEIIILGQKQAIPNTYGQVDGGRLVLNTDNDNGQIRVQSPARRDFILADFFTLWGSPFSSQCIFTHCVSADRHLTMFVNGTPNQEFDQYLIRDGDQIKIVME